MFKKQNNVPNVTTQLEQCKIDLSMLKYEKILNMQMTNNLVPLKKYQLIPTQTKKELVKSSYDTWQIFFHQEQLKQCLTDLNIDISNYENPKKLEHDFHDTSTPVNKSFKLDNLAKYDLLTNEDKNKIIAYRYNDFQIKEINFYLTQFHEDIFSNILNNVRIVRENLLVLALVNKYFYKALSTVKITLPCGEYCDKCPTIHFQRSLIFKCETCDHLNKDKSLDRRYVLHVNGKLVNCDTCSNNICITESYRFSKNICGSCIGMKVYFKEKVPKLNWAKCATCFCQFVVRFNYDGNYSKCHKCRHTNKY
jgi:hypothetical protein